MLLQGITLFVNRLVTHTLHVCCEILQLMKAVKTRVQSLHMRLSVWRSKCVFLKKKILNRMF